MFYVKKLEHEIVLEPIHFGPKLKQTIIRLLKDEVEGISLATYGYVVNVIEVPEDEIRSVSYRVVGTFICKYIFVLHVLYVIRVIIVWRVGTTLTYFSTNPLPAPTNLKGNYRIRYGKRRILCELYGSPPPTVPQRGPRRHRIAVQPPWLLCLCRTFADIRFEAFHAGGYVQWL